MNVRPHRNPGSNPVSGLRRARLQQPVAGDAVPLRHQGVLGSGVATYLLALLLIAAFSIAFYFVTDRIVNQQSATARVINLSGRQRMLAQRILRLSLERAAHTTFRPEAETASELQTTIQLLDETQEGLLHGSKSLGVAAPTAPEVLAVYNAAPQRLNVQMAAFLAHARALAAQPASAMTLADGDLLAIEQAVQGPLLEGLSAAVTANQTTSEASIRGLRMLLGRMTLVMLAILVAEALFLYRPLFRRLGLAHDELIALGRTDPLTGCLNRRAFTQEAHALVAQSRAKEQALSVLMLDIDRFKSVNDRFGHGAGDEVIHGLVMRLVGRSKWGQQLCRMGGEEFAFLLRGIATPEAMELAEDFRKLVAETPFPISGEAGKQELAVTVSVGVAELAAVDGSIFTVLGRADKALYRAKANGRNRVEVEQAGGVVVMMEVG